MVMTGAEVIEGRVEQVGSYGFVLAGREGWVSLSKFATPRPTLPQVGQSVRVGLDKSGYARTITPVGASAMQPTGQPGEPLPFAAPAQPQSGFDRDTRIMRQAVLNTATAILASGGQVVELGAVIEFAEALEQWVTR